MSNNSTSFIIGISGGSGSGKTSFINDLRASFERDAMCIISQDDYYRPREEQLLDNQNVRNFDLPSSIDLNAFYNDIMKLKGGETISRLEYTFNNEKKSPKMLVLKPAPILIVEGLFILQDAHISNALDLKILIQAKDSHKIIRRIKRDRVERNYPLEDVLYRYEHHVLPSFERFIYPHIEDVDLIINNNKSYTSALDVLSGFLRDKLGHASD